MSDASHGQVETVAPTADADEDVARQRERDALDDMIARMETLHGAVDEDAVAAIMARLRS